MPTSSVSLSVSLAHDYLTQRGGAERVALIMARAFPLAPMYTTLYQPEGTFPEFAEVDIRTSALNRIPALRRDHRLALPLLAPAVSRMHVDADVLLASSSGWAHGIRTDGRKVIYCHAPARWLYQTSRYLARDSAQARDRLARAAVGLLGTPLRRWDQRAAHSADRYLVNSSIVAQAVREVYGIDAELLPPPPALHPDGLVSAPDGIEPGFLLCVARLLPYKNVDLVIEAAATAGGTLVVVGDGPERERLTALANPERVHLLGRVDDPVLRWLYANCTALVAASYEDFGLSPLEAAAFGKPSVVLRAGGYLDTVVEGRSGVFFDEPTAGLLAAAISQADAEHWDSGALIEHARGFSVSGFGKRLREVVSEVVREQASR